MTQAEQLPNNINKLVDKINKLQSKTFLVPPIPKIDITPYLMTHRQIAKKILLVSAGAVTSAGAAVNNLAGVTQTTLNNSNTLGANVDSASDSTNRVMSSYEMNFAMNSVNMIGQLVTPESAHFIIYGKFKRDADGNLIDNEVLDPDCVLHKLAMPDTHPTLTNVKLMISQVDRVLKLLGIKQQELLDDIAQSTIAITASVTAIASAAAILPPGAGIPVAFSAFQSLMSNVMNLVSKISGVAVDMEYLNYIPLLVEAQKLDAILGLVNAQIIAINTIIDTIEGITKLLPSVPTPPGVGTKAGNPVTINVSASPNKIKISDNTDVTLKSTASNGSWEYNYQWTGPAGFTSTDKEVIIIGGPIVTSTYTCTATDKKDSSNKSSADIMVEVTF